MKRLLSIVLSALLIVSVWPMALFSITASAVTEGYYTYTISGGKAKIVDVDENIGELAETPSILGGCPVTSIGYRAFYNCKNLVHVLIPSSITKIEENAFCYTPNLKYVYITDVAAWCNIDFADPYSNPLCYASILYYADGSGRKVEKIPEGVTTIKKHSFYSYDKLTDIELPNSLKVIEDGAFSNCGIQSITIPSNVVRIGAKAFMSCDINTIYFNASDCFVHEEAFENCGIVKKVVIGENVKTMSEKAFYSRKHIETVELNAKSCSNLPWFYLCENLKNIIIGDNVTHIPSEAFSNCDAITEVNLPNSIISIGNSAFSNCNGLTRITIPDSVTSIGDSAFSNCGLTNIEVDKKNAIYYSQNNCLIQKETNKLVLGCKNSIIPNSVISIGNSAFSNCKELTKITIPNGVTSLGEYAFSNCTSLTTITLPNSLTSIESYSFNNCRLLKNITIPNSVKSMGSAVFYNCDSLTILNIPDNVTIIGNSIFDDCTSLKTIKIGKKVTNIPEYSFKNCTSLTDVNIPNSVTSIGNSAFLGCAYIDDVWFNGTKSEKENISIGANNSDLKNATWHYNTCPNEHDYSADCDVTCNSCEWIRTLLVEHTFDNNCDTECNLCDYKRTTTHDFEWVVDKSENCGKTGTKHEECSICHTKRNEGTVIAATGNHIYDNECDTECNLCEYKRTITHDGKTVWDKNESEHWHECNICGDKIDIESHNFDNACDTECNVCKYVRIVPDHSYTFNGNHTCDICKYSKTPNKPIIESKTNNSVTLVKTAGFEYSKDGTTWQTSNVFKNLSTDTTYTFYQRVKASSTAMVSEVSEGTTVTFKTAQIAPSAPVISSFTDTTVTLIPNANYEYSKDGITWQTSNVFTGLSSGTKYTFYQRHAENDTHEASDKSSGTSITTDKSKQTLIPDAPTVQGFTASSITLTPVDGCEYSQNGTTWQSSNVFSGLSCGTDYTFYQRYKETATTYVGKSSATLVARTEKGTQTAPSAPTLLSKKHNSVTLTKIIGCEYSRDGINWQTSNVFTGLAPETNYLFYQRKAENDRYYVSAASSSLTVKTDEEIDYTAVDISKIFPDTSNNAWYSDAVAYAYSSGILKGYANGKFGTSDGIQRQDFLAMLARYAGADLSLYEDMHAEFKDVGRNAYYESSVNWGKANNIVSGYNDGRFGVGDKITREQIVTFLWRYAQYKGLDVSVSDASKQAIKNQYKDFGKVSSFSQEAVLWALDRGVIGGKDPQTIAPQGNAQRCEVAQIMYNIFNKNIF